MSRRTNIVRLSWSGLAGAHAIEYAVQSRHRCRPIIARSAHTDGSVAGTTAATGINSCESIFGKEQRRATAGRRPSRHDPTRSLGRTADLLGQKLRQGAHAETRSCPRFADHRPIGSRFRHAKKICIRGDLAGFQLCRKSDRVQRYSGAIAWRCVPHSFRARGSHAANIQADADLYTFSSHDRDAMPEMRRADAPGFDRAARRQLQPVDLSLCALQLRRELFEGDVDRRCRHAEVLPASQSPADKALVGKALAGKALVGKAIVGRTIRWPSARMPDGKSRLPKPATRSAMLQPRQAR